jgi:hypothetical protein
MNRALPPGITRIIVVKNLCDHLGPTPALCTRDTGLVKVHATLWPRIPKDQQDFILGHEAGHITLDTTNEFQADEFAFKWCASQGTSLKAIVKAVSRQLSFDKIRKEEHQARLENMHRLALEYDYTVNKNKKAKPEYMNKAMTGQELEESFLGLDKKAQARKQEKHTVKMEKKKAKTDLIRARADSKVLRAESEKALADQGIVRESSLQAITKTVGQVAGGLLGTGGGNDPEPSVPDPTGDPGPGPDGNNQRLAENEPFFLGMSKKVTGYVGAGFALLVIIFLVYWFKFRK